VKSFISGVSTDRISGLLLNSKILATIKKIAGAERVKIKIFFSLIKFIIKRAISLA
jgi:hypothetical protein